MHGRIDSFMVTKPELEAYLAGGFKSLRETGAFFGLTGERMRQLKVAWGIEWPKKPRKEYPAPRCRWPRDAEAFKRQYGYCPRCWRKKALNRSRCAFHLDETRRRMRSLRGAERGSV